MSELIQDPIALSDFLSTGHHQTVGWVPTLGGLHDGHAALVKQSLKENDLTILSIYLNPTQFDQPEDLKQYPARFDKDLQWAQALNIPCIFAPKTTTMYPDNFRYQVQETEFSQYLEGEMRPGHFSGMLTIVLKFLHLIAPTRAYFGEKDYQQLQLVRGLVKAFWIKCDIVACQTVRDSDGLPLSTRLKHLSHAQLADARKITQQFLLASSQQDAFDRLAKYRDCIEYLEQHDQRLYLAFKLGSVRLIDNRLLEEHK